jgi:hypothetical protein
VCDGWRVFFSDEIEHEIERGNDEKTPDGGDSENDFGEFHGALLIGQR